MGQAEKVIVKYQYNGGTRYMVKSAKSGLTIVASAYLKKA
jgi:hypothetical protein